MRDNPEQDDNTWRRLAEDELSRVENFRRLLATFGMVVLLTTFLAWSEVGVVRRDLRPLEAAAGSREWSNLEREWILLSDALNGYGKTYPDEHLQPWWELGLAEQMGLLHVQQLMGRNPASDSSVERVTRFLQNLTVYNRVYRRLSARALDGADAVDLKTDELRMLDTLHLTFQDESDLDLQVESLLKGAFFMHALHKKGVLPDSVFGVRFVEILERGMERGRRRNDFETFSNVFLMTDVRAASELEELRVDHTALAAKLDSAGFGSLGGLRSHISKLREDANRGSAAAAIQIPGLGVRVPSNYVSLACTLVTIVMLGMMNVAFARYKQAVGRLSTRVDRAELWTVTTFRYPWLDSSGSALQACLFAAAAALPLLAAAAAESLIRGASLLLVLILIGAIITALLVFLILRRQSIEAERVMSGAIPSQF